MKKFCYVVYVETGEYSDYRMSLEAVFEDEGTADRYAAAFNASYYRENDYSPTQANVSELPFREGAMEAKTIADLLCTLNEKGGS